MSFVAGWAPNNTSVIACQQARACYDYMGERVGLIPEQYVGWAFLIFLVVSLVLLTIGIFLMATGYWERKE